MTSSSTKSKDFIANEEIRVFMLTWPYGQNVSLKKPINYPQKPVDNFINT